MKWCSIDKEFYNETKEAIRKAIEMLLDDDCLNYRTVVLVDFHTYEAKSFPNSYTAEDYIADSYTDWDERPPEGEDENLVILKYVTERDLKLVSYEGYKFFTEVNGVKIYRYRGCVEFEPELTINVYI